jgi:hypothetical protein
MTENPTPQAVATTLSQVPKDPLTQKAFAISYLSSLDSQTQNEVFQAILKQPAQGPTNYIWISIVTGILLAFIAAAFGIVWGVLYYQNTNEATVIQPIITVFTASIGFLTGLLIPSPVQQSQK